MASQPRKDQIAEALVDVLRGITKGAGYRTDLGKNVSRYRWLVTELNQSKLPAVGMYVGDADEAPEPCMGSYKERVVYCLEAWARASDKFSLDSACLDVEADVKAAVFGAGLLGLTFVTRVAPAKVQSDAQQYVDTLIGYKVVGVSVDYTWTASAP